MSRAEVICKRLFDVVVSSLLLAVTGWVIVIAALMARLDTGQSGLFWQSRVGRQGRLFFICKIRTMRDVTDLCTTVTTQNDPRITGLGRLLRRWKIDELPQLWNVLIGDMSLVGPRPDVPAYLDQLRREAPLVLSVRPGITGPASIKYRNEERLLALQPDPEAFSLRVIFPDKMRINEQYVREYSFARDIAYLWRTVFSHGSARADNASEKLKVYERRTA